MKKYVDRFHFITNNKLNFSSVSQAQKACEAGAKWIQYRAVDKEEAELIDDIAQIGAVCDDWGTTLIVTNHVGLAGKGDIQGFHLEDPNADVANIKAQLGDAYTLGVSAMDLEGVLKMARAGADYIGFGPYAKTKTKPNNYPLISLETYREAVVMLRNHNLDTPIIAVGGIGMQDVEAILACGVHGIAASAAIIEADNFDDAFSEFLR